MQSLKLKLQHLKQSKRQINKVPTDILEYAAYRGYKLTPDQKAVLLSVVTNKPTIVHAAHSVGKSVLAAILACWFFETHSTGLGVITAPTARQINNIIFRNMREILPNCPYFAPKASVLHRNASNWIQGIATNSGDSYQGLHSAGGICIIFDEASGIDQVYWDRANTMFEAGKSNHYFLAISNPYTQSSPFYLEAQKGIYEVLNISALNHPNVVEKREIIPGAVTYQTVLQRLGLDCRLAESHEAHKAFTFEGQSYVTQNPLFDVQIRGLYPEQSDFSLYNEQDINNLLIPIEDNMDHGVSIGLDVARYGSCSTVFCVRRGRNIIDIQSYKGFSIVQTADKAKEIANKYQNSVTSAMKIPIFIDGCGLGAGVVDLAGTKNINRYNFIEVLNSRKPSESKEIYVKNMRSELWLKARDYARKSFISIAMLPKDKQQMLIQELKLPTFSIDLQGRTVLEGKDELIKRLGRSPDIADAFVLSCMTPPVSFESHFGR